MASEARRHRPSSARSQALLALGYARKKRGQRGGQEIALGDAAQLFQIAVGQDGMRQLERVAVLRRLLEDVALACRCS